MKPPRSGVGPGAPAVAVGEGRIAMPPSGRRTRDTGIARPLSGSLDLAALLEGALTDAIAGTSDGPMVGKTLEREAAAILRRAGIASARVLVGRDGAAWTVDVVLPRGAPRVRQLVLRLG